MTKNKIGEFGIIYEQFQNKPKQAIIHLKKVKKGECIHALYREDIGYIDIVWGENDPKTNKGFGLKHIIAKHGNEIKQLGFEIEDFIPIIIEFGELKQKKSEKEKFVFEGRMFRFIVKTIWNGRDKKFLLSAFDLTKKPDKNRAKS